MINKEVKTEDILRIIFEEGLAMLNQKYHITFYDIIFDKKYYWEIQKPKFYFDMYPESKVDDTLWVMEILFFKVRRSR